MTSPFEILGVDPNADESEIVRAYRRRVKTAHPDHGGSIEEFQAVRTAYQQLQSGYSPEDDDALEPTADDSEAEVRERRPDHAQVEYLNYEVLDDHGWELSDDDLFEKAARSDLETADYGTLEVPFHEYLLKGAEDNGQRWPYACRGGACANCAVAVVEGNLEMPAGHILSPEMLEQGIRLSCISLPTTDVVKVVYNIKHLPGLDELQLPSQVRS